jgi:hypothetical protein
LHVQVDVQLAEQIAAATEQHRELIGQAARELGRGEQCFQRLGHLFERRTAGIEPRERAHGEHGLALEGRASSGELQPHQLGLKAGKCALGDAADLQIGSARELHQAVAERAGRAR